MKSCIPIKDIKDLSRKKYKKLFLKDLGRLANRTPKGDNFDPHKPFKVRVLFINDFLFKDGKHGTFMTIVLCRSWEQHAKTLLRDRDPNVGVGEVYIGLKKDKKTLDTLFCRLLQGRLKKKAVEQSFKRKKAYQPYDGISYTFVEKELINDYTVDETHNVLNELNHLDQPKLLRLSKSTQQFHVIKSKVKELQQMHDPDDRYALIKMLLDDVKQWLGDRKRKISHKKQYAFLKKLQTFLFAEHAKLQGYADGNMFDSKQNLDLKNMTSDLKNQKGHMKWSHRKSTYRKIIAAVKGFDKNAGLSKQIELADQLISLIAVWWQPDSEKVHEKSINDWQKEIRATLSEKEQQQAKQLDKIAAQFSKYGSLLLDRLETAPTETIRQIAKRISLQWNIFHKTYRKGDKIETRLANSKYWKTSRQEELHEILEDIHQMKALAKKLGGIDQLYNEEQVYYNRIIKQNLEGKIKKEIKLNKACQKYQNQHIRLEHLHRQTEMLREQCESDSSAKTVLDLFKTFFDLNKTLQNLQTQA